MTPSEIKQLTPDGYGGDFEMTTGGKPMTNYSERLYKALALIKYSVEYGETHGGCPPKVSAINRHGVAEAKQAITSLFKELVAEAKPTNSETQRGSVTVYGDLSERELNIIDQFEQNLLKELDEK